MKGDLAPWRCQPRFLAVLEWPIRFKAAMRVNPPTGPWDSKSKAKWD